MREQGAKRIIHFDGVDEVAWMKEFKDITQILYQVAIGAGIAPCPGAP